MIRSFLIYEIYHFIYLILDHIKNKNITCYHNFHEKFMFPFHLHSPLCDLFTFLIPKDNKIWDVSIQLL